MDRRILFTLVFLITLLSTALVAIASILTKQQWMYTVLYSLGTMWLMGIVSQIMVKHLYIGIIKPIEDGKIDTMAIKSSPLDLNIEEIEEIDTVLEKTSNSPIDAPTAPSGKI